MTNIGLASQTYDIDGAVLLSPIPGAANVKGALLPSEDQETADR